MVKVLDPKNCGPDCNGGTKAPPGYIGGSICPCRCHRGGECSGEAFRILSTKTSGNVKDTLEAIKKTQEEFKVRGLTPPKSGDHDSNRKDRWKLRHFKPQKSA